MPKRTRGRDRYLWRMLPPARDPLSPSWLVRAATGGRDAHVALSGVRNRLRSRYDADAAFLTSSGTDALVMAFRTAFARRGDRWLALPAYGCYSLVSAAVGADARLLFYDVDPETLSPDEDSLRFALERGAGTVAVAHFYGYPAAVEDAVRLAHEYDALVVEDAAQAGGATLHGAPLGSFGDLTVFSYGRGKGTTCGAGGAVLVRDPASAKSFRHEVRDVLGTDGPGRTSGWKELGLAGAQWAFGRPRLFRVPWSVPGLHLGETRYQAPDDPAPVATRAALLLRDSLSTSMGEAVLDRQRRAHELASRLSGMPGIDLIRPIPGAVPGALRFPILLPETDGDPDHEPSLGILPGYPRLLPELEEAAARTTPDGPTDFPGARRLRTRLRTLPTHDGVAPGDLDMMVRWVKRRAASEPVAAVEMPPTVEAIPDVEPEDAPIPDDTDVAGDPVMVGSTAGPAPATDDLLDFDWLPRGDAGRKKRRRRPPAPAGVVKTALPWDVLMAAVVVFVLTSVARIHLLFPVLKPLHPTQVAAIAAIFLFAINYHPARRLVTIGSPVSSLLLLMMGWMAMTVPFALRGTRSLMFLINDFSKTALLFFLIVGAVRAIRDVERLAYAYFIGAALYAGVVLVRFSLGNSWRLGNLITYDANDFALFAVTAIPIGVYFLGEAGGSIFRRIITGLALAATGVAFVQAGSRGGFLALLTVLVFMLLRHRAISFRWRVAGLGLLVVSLFMAASGKYWDEMSTILDPGADYNVTAETGRLQIWERGMGYLEKRPVFGVGPSNFPVAEGVLSPFADRQDYGIGVIWTSPHNAFVEAAVELGVPGFIIFMIFLGSIFMLLRRMSRSNERKRRKRTSSEARSDRPGLAQALMGSMLGFVVGAFFLTLAYSAMLYTLAGLAGALWKTTRVGPDQKVDRPVHPTRLKRSTPEESIFLTGSLAGSR